MERLTYKGRNGKNYVKCTGYYCGVRLRLDTVADRLAYYEDMEEQGRLVILPEGLSTAQKSYESLLDSLDKHNREAMRKIAAFIEPPEGGAEE